MYRIAFLFALVGVASAGRHEAWGNNVSTSNPGTGSSVYFCETFDTCHGKVMPHGWMSQDLLKGSYYNFANEDSWRCDNPGKQELLSPITSPAAIFDSDTTSSTDNKAENVALVSPKFDVSGVDFSKNAIVLDWDQYYVEGFDSKIFVEVWSGSSWVVVYSETKTTVNPDHQAIDITKHVMGKKKHDKHHEKHYEGIESRVRFRWTGDASWFWIVDNIRVSRVSLQVVPNGCPHQAPFKCPIDGMCVAKESHCLLDNNCPKNAPVRCLDGTCVSVSKDGQASCSSHTDCPASMPVRCADGSCAESALNCNTASNCPATKPQRCNDGSCAASVHQCPLTLACPDAFNSFPCRGGSCAASPELCPKTPATDLVCPCNKVQCLDLSCVDDYSQCQCPCEYPYLCTETRTCVQESIFCKDTSIPKPSVVEEPVGADGAVRLVRVEQCPSGHFRCFDGTCVKTLALCANIPLSSFHNDGLPLTYKCPDGSAALSRDHCDPIPPCVSPNSSSSVILQRCADGTCRRVTESCPPVEACTYGRKRCPDGRCYRECPRYDGCPIEAPIYCPNGMCAQNLAQCQAGCPADMHKCFGEDSCQAFSQPCGPTPRQFQPVPFDGNLQCIALREDSMFYDVVCVADRNHDELFATVMVPAGVFGKQSDSAEIKAFDVPMSEIRPLPPFAETISYVLAIDMPDEVFSGKQFIRLTLRVDLPEGHTAADYCLAQLSEDASGDLNWECRDSHLVADGVHFSGLVQNAEGLFVIMKKPGVCHKYRGFDDSQVEYILLGRAIPNTIDSMKALLARLESIQHRMPEIKRSDAHLTQIAKATYAFTETCLGEQWMAELDSFPAQLGDGTASVPNTTNPKPSPCDGKAGGS